MDLLSIPLFLKNLVLRIHKVQNKYLKIVKINVTLEIIAMMMLTQLDKEKFYKRENVFVKIPIMFTNGKSTKNVIRELVSKILI